MKYRLMDLLACPMCKKFPLKLIVFQQRKEERKCPWTRRPLCELYCRFKEKWIKEVKEPEKLPCDECFKYEIVEGILICENCKRWYPIKDEIPIMLPDDLRDRNEDLKFLEKYKDKIPEEIVKEGKPFNLGEAK